MSDETCYCGGRMSADSDRSVSRSASPPSPTSDARVRLTPLSGIEIRMIYNEARSRFVAGDEPGWFLGWTMALCQEWFAMRSLAARSDKEET